jgi:hypothetical protein
MKTIKLIVAVVFVFTIGATKLSAQQPVCAYTAQNDLNCTALVQIDWYDNCSGGPGTMCDSQVFTLNANGSTTNLNCGGTCTPSNFCNVVVTVLSIGTAATVAPVDNGTWYADTASGSLAAPGCLASSTSTFTVRWHYNHINIGF